uniref:NADH dehydrogenase [ubiquinone] 1 alpha subcomplex assembly factor 3 n=1 Tax=Lygus hesperus TaxID=30085 RepID=A0A0A9W973_LYGHE
MSATVCRSIFGLLLRPGIQTSRSISSSKPLSSGAYDSDGKTTITILNNEPGLGLMVDSYSKHGFRLNNGSFVVGPIALFPKTVLSWNVQNDEDINEDSLDMFTVLDPRPDILIIGFGNRSEFKPQLDRLLLKFRVEKKLNLEILQTPKAVSTFNFLNAEGRYVAAAMIPPQYINHSDDDYVAARDRKKKLYQYDD